MHVERLQEQIELQRKLCSRLEAIARRLEASDVVSVDEFIRTIQEIEMVDRFAKYFTPDQRKKIEERGRVVGQERIRQSQTQWKDLIEQIRAEMAKGTDPASECVQRLAKRYRGLIDEFPSGSTAR